MKTNYRWVISLPPGELLDILQASQSNGFTVRRKENRFTLVRPRFMFGSPVRGQIAFFLRARPTGNGSVLYGRFGAPWNFFFVVWGVSCLMMLFLYQRPFLDLIVYAMLLGAWSFFISWLFHFLSMLLFQKENAAVIKLIDDIQFKCRRQDERA